jgi:hypothetical protein
MIVLGIKCGGCHQSGKVALEEAKVIPIKVLSGKFYIHERKVGAKTRRLTACSICQQICDLPGEKRPSLSK